MRQYYKYLVVAILVAIAIISFYECSRKVTPDPTIIKPSPSATPANDWFRNALPPIVDTTEHYKEESDINKPKVAKNRKVLHNTLGQIVGDTSKTDSLLQFSKSADVQMKIDSAIRANEERQIYTLKGIDSTDSIIKDSLIVDDKRVLKSTEDTAKKDKAKSFWKGVKWGALGVFAIEIVIEIATKFF